MRLRHNVEILWRVVHMNEVLVWAKDQAAFNLAKKGVDDITFFGQRLGQDILQQAVTRLSPDTKTLVSLPTEQPDPREVRKAQNYVNTHLRKTGLAYTARYDDTANKMVFMPLDKVKLFWMREDKI